MSQTILQFFHKFLNKAFDLIYPKSDFFVSNISIAQETHFLHIYEIYDL